MIKLSYAIPCSQVLVRVDSHHLREQGSECHFGTEHKVAILFVKCCEKCVRMHKSV